MDTVGLNPFWGELTLLSDMLIEQGACSTMAV